MAATAILLAAALTSGCGTQSDPDTAGLVLISIDTCRADALGCCGGSPEVTPNLDLLAEQGVVFANTVSPVPITLPAHCSLMTGLDPTRHGVHSNLGHLLHPDLETLAEVLAHEGFATAGFVSALVLDHRFGLDQGFALYQDDLSASTRTIFGAERPGTETVALAARWLQLHRDERFFLFVHLYEPHEPYLPPPEFARLVPESPYLGEVATADAAVGKLVDALRELRLLDSTLVAVVGDHGEMLGEHGEDTHTYFVYQSALRVPFIVKPPWRPPVGRVEQLTGLVDVAPTLCGLLGVPPMAGTDGVDLSPILTSGKPVVRPQPVLCESLTPTRYGANPLRGLVGERWKYIHTSRPELYDLTRDPAESNDLAATESAVVAEQQQLLAARLASETPHAGSGPAPVVDRDTERRLAALGYASSPLDATLDRDPSLPDPKDLIGVHIDHTRALQLIATDQFAAAEPLSRRVLAALPGSWEANLTLGKLELGLGEWRDAAALFERSLELKPAQYEALRGLGEASSGLGDLERATEFFRRALPLDPEPPKAALDLACSLFALGSDEEAERTLAAVVRRTGGGPDSLNRLAQLLEQRGHCDRAAAMLRLTAASSVSAADRP